MARDSCRANPVRKRAAFGGVRTNVVQGTVHLLLFVVYIGPIFSP